MNMTENEILLIRITTLDGHEYEFYKAGWSIIITKK
jgi:hypothetical protein